MRRLSPPSAPPLPNLFVAKNVVVQKHTLPSSATKSINEEDETKNEVCVNFEVRETLSEYAKASSYPSQAQACKLHKLLLLQDSKQRSKKRPVRAEMRQAPCFLEELQSRIRATS